MDPIYVHSSPGVSRVEDQRESNELNQAAEAQLEVGLPSDLKSFLLEVGSVWTPSILDIIVDRSLVTNDLSQVWGLQSIVDDRLHGWTSRIEDDLTPFASDSMGNIFGFRASDIRSFKECANVYFVDRDFGTVEPDAVSFMTIIARYHALPLRLQ